MLWEFYNLYRGTSFRSHWSNALIERERNVIFICGHGFDPRSCLAIKEILNIGGVGKRDVFRINIDAEHEQKLVELATQNAKDLQDALHNRGTIIDVSCPTFTSERRRITGSAAAKLIDAALFADYHEIIVDISALPRAVFFPILGKLMLLMNDELKGRNLHAVVCEDPELDRGIRDVGVDESAEFIHGFVADLRQESSENVPRIWFPILGEGQSVQLERLYQLVKPEEICPVLPSPARNPRRADNLFIEYQSLLLDEWSVEPQNIIYAFEQNPFEAYRQMCQTISYYNQALKPVRGCRAVLSALSSKLLSLSCLLAAHDLNRDGAQVAIADIQAQSYDIERGDGSYEYVGAWLMGDCYED